MLMELLSGKLSLRFILVIPFVLIMVITISLANWFSRRSGQLMIQKTAYTSCYELSQHTNAYLKTVLATPQLINAINAQAFQLKQLNLSDLPALERYLWRQIQLFKPVQSIAFSDEKGNFIGVERRANETFGVSLVGTNTHHKFYHYMTDSRGNKTDLLSLKSNYDLHQQLWYKAAEHAKKASWSPFYVRTTSNNVSFSAIQPLFTQEGDFVGVLKTEPSLLGINQFLHQLILKKSGVIFLLERSGELIASSTAEEPFQLINYQRFKRIYAKNSEIPLIRLATQYLYSQVEHLTQINTATQGRFFHDKQPYFLQVVPFTDRYGIDWLVVVVLSPDDLITVVNTNANILFWLAIFALVATIFVGLWLAQRIIEPINKLKMTAIQFLQGNWKPSVVFLERSDELGELTHCFEQIGKRFQQSLIQLENKGQGCIQQLSKAYKHLKASQTHLVQAEKMTGLGQILAGIAHEINTPLCQLENQVLMARELFITTRDFIATYDKLITVLLSPEPKYDQEYIQIQLVELVQASEQFNKEHSFEEIQQLFADMLLGINEVLKLVEHLRNFSQNIQAEMASIDLNHCLDGVLVIAYHLWNERITIKKQYGKIPKLQCSPSQINQVLLNILTNAIEAIEYKGTILIKTRADSQFVYVTIQDNGKGIPKALLPKVFQVFFSTKTLGQNAGLGLSISYQIIKQHGGKIKVISQAGKGTQVVISLPIK
jgi:signal transduction histidine kinase